MKNNQSSRRNRRSREMSEYSGPMFVIRWKWLFGGIGVVLLGALILFGISKFRSTDSTAFLLEKVLQQVAEGKWRDAVEMLDRELQSDPKNKVVAKRLAELFEEHGTTDGERNTAITYYNTLLTSANPRESVELLERILKLSIKQTNIDSDKMATSAKTLLGVSPDNPVGWKALALARYAEHVRGKFRPQDSAPRFIDEILEKAMERNPYDVKLSTSYAFMLRDTKEERAASLSDRIRGKTREDRNSEADQIMADMVKNHPKDIDALFAGLNYRRAFQLITTPIHEDEDLKAILEIVPQNPEAMTLFADGIMMKAFQTRAMGDMEEFQKLRDEAIAKYKEVISYFPAYVGAYQRLAALYAEEGNHLLQIQTLEAGCKATQQSNSELLIDLIRAQTEARDVKKARESLYFLYRNIDMMPTDVNPQLPMNFRRIALLLEAQIYAIDNDSSSAIAKFRQVFTPEIPEHIDPGLIFQAVSIYADLLTQRMQLDLAAEVYRQAVVYFERNIQPTDQADSLNFRRLELMQIAEIDSWERLGRNDNAQLAVGKFISILERMSAVNPEDARARLALATWQLQVNLMKTKTSRQWGPLQVSLETLQNMKDRLATPWVVDFIKARMLWEKDDRSPETRDTVLIPLRANENTHGGNLAFLTQLVGEYRQYGAIEDINRVMTRIHDLPEGLPVWYAIQASQATAGGNLEAAAKFVNEALELLPEEQHGPFLNMKETLSRDAANSANRVTGIDAIAEMLAKSDQNSVMTLFQRIMLELDRGNYEAAKNLEEELRKKEGEDGTLWVYSKANRLVLEAKSPSDPLLDEAEKLQKSIVGKRPNWDLAYILDSVIQEKRENLDGMISAELQALRLGNRNPQIYRELIYLLGQKNQIAEAERILKDAFELFPEAMQQPYVHFTMPFQSMFKDFLRTIRRKDYPQAQTEAENWLKLAREKGLSELEINLFKTEVGREFLLAEEYARAEIYLSEIAKQGGHAVLPLASLKIRSGDLTGYDMIIEEMIKAKDLDGFSYITAIMGMAGSYPPSPEQFQRIDHWLEQQSLDSVKDIPTLLIVAQYRLVREQNSKAIPVYRKMLALDPNNPMILNDLSLLQASEEKEFESSHQMIDKALEQAPNSPALLDTKGLIFLIQGKPAEAVPLFEKAVQNSAQSPLYVMHLAVAQLRDGETEKAKINYDSVKTLFEDNRENMSNSNRAYVEELDQMK